MIEEQAVVVGIDQDKAVLEIIRSRPCGLCGQTRGCGISVWGKLLGHRNKVFLAVNQINARTGDNVVVGIDEKALLAGSLAVYVVPLFFLLAGALLGGSFASGRQDLYALAGAGAGLFLGLLWLKDHAAGGGINARYQPVVLRLADAGVSVRMCQRGE